MKIAETEHRLLRRAAMARRLAEGLTAADARMLRSFADECEIAACLVRLTARSRPKGVLTWG